MFVLFLVLLLMLMMLVLMLLIIPVFDDGCDIGGIDNTSDAGISVRDDIRFRYQCIC